MNRILQADVILTLTQGQADFLIHSLSDCAAQRWSDGHECSANAIQDLRDLVREQCVKQGVYL